MINNYEESTNMRRNVFFFAPDEIEVLLAPSLLVTFLHPCAIL